MDNCDLKGGFESIVCNSGFHKLPAAYGNLAAERSVRAGRKSISECRLQHCDGKIFLSADEITLVAVRKLLPPDGWQHGFIATKAVTSAVWHRDRRRIGLVRKGPAALRHLSRCAAIRRLDCQLRRIDRFQHDGVNVHAVVHCSRRLEPAVIGSVHLAV